MASYEQKEAIAVESASRSDSQDATPIDSNVPAINNKEIISEAVENVNFEHNLTVREAIKYYKWAIFWSLTISMTVVMEGYDMILIGNFFAYPTFQIKYGEFVGVGPTTPSGYQLTAPWQAGLGNSAVAGAFVGGIMSGFLVDRFGQRRTIFYGLIALTGFIFITFFATGPEMLSVGQVLCGLPWGVFVTSAAAYASELLPMVLRAYFTSWSNMAFIIGQFICAGVLRACLNRTDEWGYRIPFAIQWFWPLILIPLIYFAPESPWNLVRRGKLEEAEAALRRLQSADCPIDPKKTLAAIVYTNNLEEELSVGTSYWDCFKGFELRRTEIACMAMAGQVLVGTPIAYNATYFYEQIGLDTTLIYNLNIGGYALALGGAFASWIFLVPRVGRRTTYLWGTAWMVIILFIIGILTSFKDVGDVGEAQAYLTIVWKFIYQLSSGQLGWIIPAEVGSTRVRQKTIVLARNAYYIWFIIGIVLQPYFMSPMSWNVGGRTAFFWGALGFVFFVWAFFRLPETKDRTFDELDMLFAKKISARKFATTNVNVFDPEETRELKQEYNA